MDAIPQFTRDVLVSIRPFYASKILGGEKTVELRRRFPEIGTNGAIAFIYSSSPVSAIVGYARIKHVLKLPIFKIWKEYGAAACISRADFNAYFAGLRYGFAILFEGVGALNKKVNASDLRAQFGIVPPQSYRYVADDVVALLSDEEFQATYRHLSGRNTIDERQQAHSCRTYTYERVAFFFSARGNDDCGRRDSGGWPGRSGERA